MKKLITFQIDFINSKNEIVDTIFNKFPDFISALNFSEKIITNSNGQIIDCYINDLYKRSLQK